MLPDHRETLGIGVGVGEFTPEENSGEAPLERLRGEVRRQATPETLAQARPFARTCADRIAVRGGIGGALRARELLYDALADTWLGTVHWDPASKPLGQHLTDTLAWRARDAAHTSARTVYCGTFIHDEEDAETSEEDQDRSQGIPVAAAFATPAREHDGEETSKALARLQRAAEGDEEVSAILLALQRDPRHVRRATMAAVPQMTLKRYYQARARLMALARHLIGTEAQAPVLHASRLAPPTERERETPAAPKRTLRAPRSRKVGSLGGVLPLISARNREP